MHGAELRVALTSVDQKRAVRLSATAGQRRSERTVTGHHRHIIDVGLRIAAHAKALRILISEIEAAPRIFAVSWLSVG